MYVEIGADEVTKDAALDPAGLVAVAVAHAFALFVGVSVAANISGGHLNPAVTLGLAVGGNISIITGLLYWIFQLLGSIVACLLLKFVTSKVLNYCITMHLSQSIKSIIVSRVCFFCGSKSTFSFIIFAKVSI